VSLDSGVRVVQFDFLFVRRGGGETNRRVVLVFFTFPSGVKVFNLHLEPRCDLFKSSVVIICESDPKFRKGLQSLSSTERICRMK
jgi:hypothetical protein